MKKIISILLALAMTASALNVGYADENVPVDDSAEDIVVSEAAVETDQNIALYSHSSTDTAYTVDSGTFYFDETTGTITEFVPSPGYSMIDYIDYLSVPSTINGIKVKKIGRRAFANIKLLIFTLNVSNIEQIESEAFYNCMFETLNISADRIGSNVIERSSVEYLYVTAGDIDANAFTNFDGELEANVYGNIGTSAFENCKNLIITFTRNRDGKSTRTIGANAFKNCTSINQISLLDGVTTIGANAFNGCSVLERALIPESVGYIGINAFDNCSSPLTVNCTKDSYADNKSLYPEGTIIKYGIGMSDVIAKRLLNVEKNSAIRYNDELNALRIIPYMEIAEDSTIYIKINNGNFDSSLVDECEYHVPKSGETWDRLIEALRRGDTIDNLLKRTIKAANSNKLPYKLEYVDSNTVKVILFPLPQRYAGVTNSEVSSGIPTYDIALPAVAGSEKAEVTIDVDGNGTTIENSNGIAFAYANGYEPEQKYSQNSYFEVIDKKTVAPGTKLSDETTLIKFKPITGTEIEKDTTLYFNIKNGVFDKNLIESCAYHVPKSGQDYDTLYEMFIGLGADDRAIENVLNITIKAAHSNEMPYKMEYVDDNTLKVQLFPLPVAYAGVEYSDVSAGIPSYYFKLPVVTGQANGDVEIAIDHDNKNPDIRPSGWYAVATVTGGTAPTTEPSTQPTTAAQVTTKPTTQTTTQKQTTQATTQKPTTQATTQKPTTQATTQKTTEKPTETTTKAAVTEKPSSTTTKAVVTEKPSETTTKTIVTEKPSVTTTKTVVTEKPSETTTKTIVTEKPTETTTKAIITEGPTETTTKRSTSSNSGGGGGKGPSKDRDNKTTATTVTEASTETTTAAKTTGGSKQNDPSDDGTGKSTVISGNVYVTIGKKAVTIDDKEYAIDTAAYIQPESNSTLVPLRFVALAIAGGDIEKADSNKNISWDAATKTATITAGGNVISFTAGSELMTINNNPQIMENGVKAEIKDSRMFIPFRALGKALGVQVDWDAESKTAIYRVK